MARSSKRKHGPRIRKTAPTVRERLEAARENEDIARPKRLSAVRANVARPFKKFSPADSRAGRIIKKPFRLLGRALAWLVPKYFVNSWRELRQVYWPNRRDTWRLTLAVFVFAIVFGALVAGVDKGLDEVFKKVVLK